MTKKRKDDETMQEQYLDLEEASKEVGLTRASIYNYMDALDIRTYKFPRNRRTYLTRTDVERIRLLKQQPKEAGLQAEERRERKKGRQRRIEKHAA